MTDDLLPVAEALERLMAPTVFEAFSFLTGAPLFIVDLRAPDPPSPPTLKAAVQRLRQLPCPTIGVGAAQGATAQELAPHFDVHLASDAELDRLRDGVAQHPQAATALVQLLRLGERLDLQSGLIAESFAYAMLQAGPEFAHWLATRSAGKRPKAYANPPVAIQREGGRLEIRLDRPENRNAFSAAMRDALIDALQLAQADASLTEIVLAGNGPDFCSGGDLTEFGTLSDPVHAHGIRSTRSVGRVLAELSDRLRVEVHGACVGAGIELPAFAAHVTCREGTTFALPELQMGLIPGAGGTASLPRRIGRQRTAWWALTGVGIDAATALDWGLVDEIVPD